MDSGSTALPGFKFQFFRCYVTLEVATHPCASSVNWGNNDTTCFRVLYQCVNLAQRLADTLRASLFLNTPSTRCETLRKTLYRARGPNFPVEQIVLSQGSMCGRLYFQKEPPEQNYLLTHLLLCREPSHATIEGESLIILLPLNLGPLWLAPDTMRLKRSCVTSVARS